MNDSLNSWLKRCEDARDGHYKRAEKLFDLSQFLGYLLICSTVFVTAFSFFDYKSSEVIFWGITAQPVIIFISGIASVISGIVSQARFGERAEMHRSSGARYGNLTRDIERIQVKRITGSLKDSELDEQVDSIIKQWNDLSENSLLTPHNKNQKKFYFCLFFVSISLFAVLFFYYSQKLAAPC